ncbi:MAG: hypothetical protein AB7T37_02730 [Dehalococcoidia bacterium]
MTALAGNVETEGPSALPRLVDLKAVAYWVSLGAAAGGLGGLAAGGIGGRTAMFFLRLTSDDSVRGVQSDDDFTIGQFDLASTLNLLFLTTVLGVVVGLVVVFGRPFFPKRGMPIAWALAGATAGGAILIQRDGVDFTLLEPHWFAIALFIAIPAAGAGLIAWLVDLYPHFWWRHRKRTALAATAILPALVLVPVPVVAVLVGGLWWLAMRVPSLRRLPEYRAIRVAALSVYLMVVGFGVWDLASDVPAII